MKFICDGLTLSEAVLKVSKACAVRTTAPENFPFRKR